jgi:tripartite-type tricarboxylate transporter receptor subunit TctC
MDGHRTRSEETNLISRRHVIAGAAAALSTAALPARAQAFPSRPIRIVPFGTAGGPIDTLARVYGDKLSARWGQPVIVEPKPGASGIIAADFVAKAAPDGHTVLMTLPLTHVNNHILQPRLPYDPVADFQPLSMLATGGPMLVARADAPYGNLKEFVEYAKKKGRMTYGTWGNGSTAHLFGELLRRQTGADLVHVAYKAEAAAHNDLFGQAIDFAWANPSTARGHTQGGKMKVLGISGTSRVSSMPNVPTFKEQGFQGFDIDSWIGVYGPDKMPEPIVQAWTTALREITAMPDVQARLTGYGFEPLGNTPAQFIERYRADYPRMAELIKAAGVKAE